MTNNVQVLSGDACEVDPNQRTCIAHVVNNRGLWGAGFALALSQHWSEPEQFYKIRCKKYKNDRASLLGKTQTVNINQNLTIINMFAMNGVYNRHHNPQPLDMNALMLCLRSLRIKAEIANYDVVQMPMIGAGLARGHWPTILKLIDMVFSGSRVKITIKTL